MIKNIFFILVLAFTMSCAQDKASNTNLTPKSQDPETTPVTPIGGPTPLPVFCKETDPMEESDGRSSILVIGDSISIGYTPTVKSNIPNYQVIHNQCNSKSSRFGVSNIDSWLAHKDHWEVCTINHGLHDMAPSNMVPLSEYENNLTVEINKLKEKCDKILFVLSTPVQNGEKTFGDFGGVLIPQANEVASNLMRKLNIPICDLYSEGLSLSNEHLYSNDLHFTNYGYMVLGNKVSSCIDKLINH